jgi:Skp family chaperone for outer membrane proteins
MVMHRIAVAAGFALAMLSAPAAAQGAAAKGACFVQVQKLMADPPEGVGDLGAAIRQLDETLRPQVEEINRKKSELEAVETRQMRAMRDENDDSNLVALQDDASRLSTELEALQDRLRQDYAAQRQAIVGPIQAKVSERAQAFATAKGCAEIKLARAPELPALQAAAAEDVTGEFVAWYSANRSS